MKVLSSSKTIYILLVLHNWKENLSVIEDLKKNIIHLIQHSKILWGIDWDKLFPLCNAPFARTEYVLILR